MTMTASVQRGSLDSLFDSCYRGDQWSRWACMPGQRGRSQAKNLNSRLAEARCSIKTISQSLEIECVLLISTIHSVLRSLRARAQHGAFLHEGSACCCRSLWDRTLCLPSFSVRKISCDNVRWEWVGGIEMFPFGQLMLMLRRLESWLPRRAFWFKYDRGDRFNNSSSHNLGHFLAVIRIEDPCCLFPRCSHVHRKYLGRDMPQARPSPFSRLPTRPGHPTRPGYSTLRYQPDACLSACHFQGTESPSYT